MNKTINYFSMFSGVGAGELGIESVLPDAQCVGICEIDKYVSAIHKYHFPNIHNYGDTRTLNYEQLLDFDFLIAGFPCQSFSIAGRQLGFNDTRGTLFFEIARILSNKRPRHFLLENVKGLISHEGGKTFTTILKVLADLGYFVETIVPNSKDFSVPQNRERVFFIGHLGGECCGEILSFGADDPIPANEGKTRQRSSQAEYSTTLRASASMKADGTYISESDIRVIGDTGIGTSITATDGKGAQLIQVGQVGPKDSEAHRVYSPKGISRTIKNGGGMGAKTGLYDVTDLCEPRAVLTPDRLTKRQNGRRMKDPGEPSFTLTAQDRHGIEEGDTKRIRRLTPIECERLQGLPDNWTQYGNFDGVIKKISDTQRYKGTGNAFTVNVIEAIVRRMIEKGCIE